MRTTSVLALLFLCVSVAFGDLYLHMPRGSNDRLNEANTNRNNANRLFDSQNNAKGGYCYGPMMSYYEGSRLPVEWTVQHGCGNPKVECNIVIQYMCGKTSDPDSIRIRDGTTTNTIEDNPTTYNTKDGNGDFVYGMHESYDYYQQCKTRERNMGLFIADREEEGGLSEGRASAIFTRQNNNGNRHGFECTEERDYWPYWHASPWRDIVVLSQKSEYCDFYKKESYNVKSRYHCEVDGTYASYNNEQACNVGGGKWVEDKPLGVPAPDCVVASWSRENHLGNGINGFTNSYNWTLPSTGDEDCIKEDNCECVLRIRYNISSGDLKNNPSGDFTDWKFNADNSPVKENSIVSQDGNEFKLALNTAQYGRTFQDRSYVFGIKPRPKGVAKHARIYNIGVRGKRGNIVQTYPATEYDFTPDILEAHVRDYIHFQWTGCDTNPAGNAGEGTDQTDRSNVVQIADLGKNYPADDDWLKKNKNLFQNEYHRKRFAYLDQTGCPDYDTLLANNGGDAGQADQDPANCYKLNAASAYFDGKLMMVNSTGTYHYMSTRNNNFTNRGQKASVVFTTVLSSWAIGVVIVGSVLFAGSLGVAGAMFYAKSHPQSGIAASLNRF